MVNDKWRRPLGAGLLIAGFLGVCGLWAVTLRAQNDDQAPASQNVLSEASPCAKASLLTEAILRTSREDGGGKRAAAITVREVRHAERDCEAASQAPTTRTILDDQMKVLFANVLAR